jgi:hypothetical protein
MRDPYKFLIGRRVPKRKKLRENSSYKSHYRYVLAKSLRQAISEDRKSTNLGDANYNKDSNNSPNKAKIKNNDRKEDKPVLVRANLLQDLDDIFESMKPKKDVPAVSQSSSHQHSNQDQDQDQDQSYGLVQSSGGRSSIISPNPAVHRFDQATGLPVYKYTALLVGDGGGTALCPFDCKCCF